MLHWEDFGADQRAPDPGHATPTRCCTFNDDMQGTAAVVLAAAFSAVRAAGSRMRDQRVVIHGAGTAGLGIADMMRDQMIREGLSPRGGDAPVLRAGPRRAARSTTGRAPAATSSCPTPARGTRSPDWGVAAARPIGLADVVAHVQPTMLIGTSTQAGAFTEAHRAGHGRAHRAADHHAAVQPDLARPRRCPPT